jgi:threonyl-tRNA synthetase
MFFTESESRDYAVKPMNCPGHVQIFNQGLKSYRDLPLRLAEFGSCHRNEPSGALHGLMRVRGFTQDDAHIFCTEAQIEPEVSRFIDLLQRVYADFGFDEILVKLSTRPAKRVGSDAQWDKAEGALKAALERKGLKYDVQAGEGAFYGPKIEFSLKDSIGRVWQCGTMQLDFSMPERLGAEYVGEDNARHVPVMLHRAVLGSFERFIGILIEHHAGAMPLWLAPVQVAVLSITENQTAYAERMVNELKQAGIRAVGDLRNEKISYKIREHSLQKLPYQAIVGDKEVAAQKVAVRTRKGEDLGQMSLADFVSRLRGEEARLGRAAQD